MGQELNKSIKAASSIKDLFDNGPLMTILSIQTLAIAILIYLLIKSYSANNAVQAQLYEKMIERTDQMIELRINEKVTPVVEDAKIAVDKLNSTREVIDTASQKLRNILNNNDVK